MEGRDQHIVVADADLIEVQYLYFRRDDILIITPRTEFHLMYLIKDFHNSFFLGKLYSFGTCFINIPSYPVEWDTTLNVEDSNTKIVAMEGSGLWLDSVNRYNLRYHTFRNVKVSEVANVEHIAKKIPTQSEDGWREHWKATFTSAGDTCSIYYSGEACTIPQWIGLDIDEWKNGAGKVTAADVENARNKAVADIETARSDVEMTEEEQTIINGYIEAINETYDIELIDYDLNLAILLIEKRRALNTIQAAMDGETSDYLTGLVQSYIDAITNADNTKGFERNVDRAVDALVAILPTYRAIKSDVLSMFGDMLSPHTGPSINVVGNDGTKVKFYNVKGVEYKK